MRSCEIHADFFSLLTLDLTILLGSRVHIGFRQIANDLKFKVVVIEPCAEDWRKPAIVHHCSLGCCANPEESRAELSCMLCFNFTVSIRVIPRVMSKAKAAKASFLSHTSSLS